jgi:nicotinamidase-related amidase
MSTLTHLITTRSPVSRSFALAALLGATILANPLTAAYAADPNKSAAAQDATSMQGETVEQRITALHTELKITPEQDAKWNDVAQAMRENAAKMEKLVAEKRTSAPQEKTAVEDLKTYSAFAQAHVDGLKNLTASFEVLYRAMPDGQKKNADTVFQNFGHQASN